MPEPPIIDCHTHLFWYPDHLSDQYAGEALASKLVKLRRSGGLAYSAGAVIYALRRPDPAPAVFGYHELFHALTIVGVACQYVAIAFFIVRAG